MELNQDMQVEAQPGPPSVGSLPPVVAHIQADVARLLGDFTLLDSLGAQQADRLAYGIRLLGEQASNLREQCDTYFARWASPRPALPRTDAADVLADLVAAWDAFDTDGPAPLDAIVERARKLVEG